MICVYKAKEVVKEHQNDEVEEKDTTTIKEDDEYDSDTLGL
mgnify:CR=1 FL=1